MGVVPDPIPVKVNKGILKDGQPDMIKTIEIDNFQSHLNTVLELSEGVNVIKGRSHTGKSSIVRALKWALLNEPRGDHFVSHFKSKEETTSVGIEFENGSYIVRERGDKFNGYRLPNTDLAALRSDLPEEVTDITHINHINIQTQAEQYYMLKETPGKVAKELNSLVGLDIIDQTITKLNKLQNENTARMAMLHQDSIKAEAGLADLEYLDDLEDRVIGIETAFEKYKELFQKKQRIIKLSEEIEEEQGRVEDNKEWLTIKEPVAEIRALLKKHAQKQAAYTKIKNAYDDIAQAEIVRENSDSRAKKLVKRKSDLLKRHADEFCSSCGAHISHWRNK
jgi:DNA repair exonuclease SbcCD ATPase subunit